MGNAVTWCTNPGDGDCHPALPSSPLLQRMHSFSFDGDARGQDDNQTAIPETPGGKLLRDYYNHVVETDSGTDEGDLLDEKLQLPALIHPTIPKKLAIDSTLHMYSTIDLLATHNEPHGRKVRAQSVDSVLRSPNGARSPVNKRDWAYKPFWCDLPQRALSPSSPVAS
ncbi:hypothetical protein ACHHYP_02278 [Achlya hypogyna]|uniref:Uncharacterized protein n=1 Tax=Achlya hypogyna TaxID=1202772 RepID=A0A1V9Z708_ACHHY|nr:hypothetical protein ACHHYP_02278 [Achlya hypogyna]